MRNVTAQVLGLQRTCFDDHHPDKSKRAISTKDLASPLSHVETLLSQNLAMRRAGEIRRVRQTWLEHYDRALPEIERRLEPSFQTLHALLREKELREFFRNLQELLCRHVETDLRPENDGDET